MRKILVLCLALMLVFSITGTAFAGQRSHKSNDKSKVTVNVNAAKVSQKASICNEAEAKSGDAVAIGNISFTAVKSSSEAESGKGCKSDADNDSKVIVVNYGTANAHSGEATAKNTGDNEISVDVDQTNR